MGFQVVVGVGSVVGESVEVGVDDAVIVQVGEALTVIVAVEVTVGETVKETVCDAVAVQVGESVDATVAVGEAVGVQVMVWVEGTVDVTVGGSVGVEVKTGVRLAGETLNCLVQDAEKRTNARTPGMTSRPVVGFAMRRSPESSVTYAGIITNDQEMALWNGLKLGILGSAQKGTK